LRGGKYPKLSAYGRFVLCSIGVIVPGPKLRLSCLLPASKNRRDYMVYTEIVADCDFSATGPVILLPLSFL
jgi:hypothetical protein